MYAETTNDSSLLVVQRGPGHELSACHVPLLYHKVKRLSPASRPRWAAELRL